MKLILTFMTAMLLMSCQSFQVVNVGDAIDLAGSNLNTVALSAGRLHDIGAISDEQADNIRTRLTEANGLLRSAAIVYNAGETSEAESKLGQAQATLQIIIRLLEAAENG